jgi:hypothetical protein
MITKEATMAQSQVTQDVPQTTKTKQESIQKLTASAIDQMFESVDVRHRRMNDKLQALNADSEIKIADLLRLQHELGNFTTTSDAAAAVVLALCNANKTVCQKLDR